MSNCPYCGGNTVEMRLTVAESMALGAESAHECQQCGVLLAGESDEDKPKRRRRSKCAVCGYPVANTEDICGECACEDDGL